MLRAKEISLRAGIAGEKKLADILQKNSFSFDHRIIHDLSLLSAAHFQIDSLFITRYYAVTFEVKNISGRLLFNDHPPQLIRTRETGEVDGFECPAVQVKRNQELLDIWLRGRNIRIPLYTAVVLAYPKQIVDKAPSKTKVLFPSLVPPFIRDLPRKSPIIDDKTFEWLTNELVNSHIRYIPRPVSEVYQIPRDAFQTGVICPLCGAIGIKKVTRSWFCQRCQSKIKLLAYEKAIREWFLLFGGKMTNKDCRDFLHVDTRTASRILNSMSLIPSGSFKNRAYSMTFHEKITNRN